MTPEDLKLVEECREREWRPIETAPKDGTEVLLWATHYQMLVPDRCIVVGAYSSGWWTTGGHRCPFSHTSHWMPLPARPLWQRGSKKIVTYHVYPPIPIRQFDWCAYYDGEEERGQCGYGATEAEAIADLANWESAE